MMLLPGMGELQAQQGSISGVVREAGSGTPLQGAQVAIPNLQLGGLARAGGRYSLEDIPAGTHTVTVEYIGYATVSQEVQVVANQTVLLDFVIRQQAFALNEIVVTGTAGVTERRQIGHSIGRVEAAELVEMGPITTVNQLLQGRLAGASILQRSGNIGSGTTMALRGISSVEMNSTPLFYIDGVRVTNDGARLNDLNPADIESVEVVKGPAASTLYGSEASNGVVQIITKKGQSGQAQFNAQVRLGSQFWNDAAEWIPTNGARDPATGQVVLHHPLLAEEAAGRSVIFNGMTQTYNLDVTGGTGDFGYYASLSYQDDEGIVPNNWIEQIAGRVNVSAQAREDLRINAGLSYTKANIGRAPEGFTGTLGYFGQVIFASPLTLNTRRRGFLQSVPEETWKVRHRDDIHHTTWNINVNHDPVDWFSHRLTSGIDMVYVQNGRLFPRQEDPGNHMWGRRLAQGWRDVDDGTELQTTLDYAATATLDVTSDIRSATSAGIQYYTRETHTTSAEGQNFPAPALTTVSTASERFAGEIFSENKSWGVYIQERVEWRDQIFITGAIRGDDNSAFGVEIDPVIYPKLSGSWVLSDADFFDMSWVNQLQVRAAWGQAGRQPGSFDAIRTYAPAIARNDQPGVSPSNPGNPNLKPERSSEVEVGFDAELFNGRWSLEFTGYQQTTTDALLEKDVAPSTGFSGQQWVNIGQVDNQGFDFSTTIVPLVRSGLSWDVTLNLSHTTNEIIDMGDIDFISRGRGNAHAEGYPVGGTWAHNVVSADWDPVTQRAVNILCATENGSGPLPCSEAGEVYLGPGGPDWNASLGTTLQIGQNLRLAALAEGFFEMRVMSVQQWARDEVFRNSPEAAMLSDNVLLAAAIQTSNGYGYWINRNDYIRIREVSAHYTLPSEWASMFGASRASLGVLARNPGFLYVHEEMADTDPESRRSSDFYYHSRQNIFPQLTRIEGSVRVTF
jgi:TonB-linked SusC/RagA family outer membrane protein